MLTLKMNSRGRRKDRTTNSNSFSPIPSFYRSPLMSCMILVLTLYFNLGGNFIGGGSNNVAFAFAFTKIPKSAIDQGHENNRGRFFTRKEIKNHDFRSSILAQNSMKMKVEEKEQDGTSALKISQGRFLLGLVALLYGTLNVSLRFVYDVPDVPPTAAALSASRGWIALACFLPPLLLNGRDKKGEEEIDMDPDKASSLSSLFKSGMELAVWNFLAQGLLNVGLLTTGSARASFLTQCSVLFTPIISTLIGKQLVGQKVWFGCFIALVGLMILTVGGGTAVASSSSELFSFSLSSGDLFVLGGALSWSMYLFRVSILGPKHSNNEIQLQGVKTGLVALLYSVWWFVSSIMNAAEGETIGLFGSLPPWMVSSYVVWVALFFSAIGPGTIADILQQKGQSVVSASEANVILSSEPVFATLFAVFLFGEGTSLFEIVGGGLILCAALIASAPDKEKT